MVSGVLYVKPNRDPWSINDGRTLFASQYWFPCKRKGTFPAHRRPSQTSTSRYTPTSQSNQVMNDVKRMRRRTFQHPDQLRALHRRPDLDPNRIPDPAEIFHVCARQLARAVPNPEKVCSGVVECLLRACGTRRRRDAGDGCWKCGWVYGTSGGSGGGCACRACDGSWHGEFACQRRLVSEHQAFVADSAPTSITAGSRMRYLRTHLV